MSELSEAIETLSLWVDQWANDQAELDEVSDCDKEERIVIAAALVVLKAARQVENTPVQTRIPDDADAYFGKKLSVH